MPGRLRLFSMQILLTVFLAMGFRTAGAAVAVPAELQAVGTMTSWDVSVPDWNWARFPERACEIKDANAYDVVLMNHDVDSKLDDKSATREVQALDRKVVRYLEEERWVAMHVWPNGGGIPDTRRCYQRQGVVVQIYQTTGRCTMNSPCTAYDGFTVMVYTPKREIAPPK